MIFDAVERAAATRRRPGAGRHRRPPAHQGQPDGGAAQGAPGGREGRRARSARCCSCSTPPPARTASSRPSSSPTAVELTGVVLTKLDGSAKGGIVVAIQAQLGIPVKLVGLGETRRRPRSLRRRRVRRRPVLVTECDRWPGAAALLAEDVAAEVLLGADPAAVQVVRGRRRATASGPGAWSAGVPVRIAAGSAGCSAFAGRVGPAGRARARACCSPPAPVDELRARLRAVWPAPTGRQRRRAGRAGRLRARARAPHVAPAPARGRRWPAGRVVLSGADRRSTPARDELGPGGRRRARAWRRVENLVVVPGADAARRRPTGLTG